VKQRTGPVGELSEIRDSWSDRAPANAEAASIKAVAVARAEEITVVSTAARSKETSGSGQKPSSRGTTTTVSGVSTSSEANHLGEPDGVMPRYTETVR